MSDPTALYIMQAVKACAAIPDGTGDYVNDLTGAGAVAVDERFPAGAKAIVFLPDIGRSPAIRLLSKADRTATVYIQGRTDPQSGYETRITAALRLANDLARAIDTNFYAQLDALSADLSNTVTTKNLSVATVSGLAEGNLGALVVVFTVAYRVTNYTGF